MSMREKEFESERKKNKIKLVRRERAASLLEGEVNEEVMMVLSFFKPLGSCSRKG